MAAAKAALAKSVDKPEVVVIGGGLGGLSAAIHLRLKGHAVTLYEANALVGGRANQIEKDGFKFDTGPSLLNYPWVFEELFEAAGRKLSDYVELIAVDPSVSFQWADGTRFTLSSNLQNLLNECERLEPGVRPNVLAFLRDAEIKYRASFDKLVFTTQPETEWLIEAAAQIVKTVEPKLLPLPNPARALPPCPREAALALA